MVSGGTGAGAQRYKWPPASCAWVTWPRFRGCPGAEASKGLASNCTALGPTYVSVAIKPVIPSTAGKA